MKPWRAPLLGLLLAASAGLAGLAFANSGLANSSLANSSLAKPKVASINLCTDQLVLALADDDQILGLSALSRDPAMSRYHERAGGFRLLSGTAEDVLALKPDLVVTATLAKPLTRSLLAPSGVRVSEFADARSIAEVKAQILAMGALLDQGARADAAVAAIDRAAAAREPGAALTILPLERRGWVSGRDSLLHEVLEKAGYRNLGGERVAYGGRLPLETIVTLKPDRLLLFSASQRAVDQGTALLHHPALAHLRMRSMLTIPENLLVCAGPMLAEAFERLRPAP